MVEGFRVLTAEQIPEFPENLDDPTGAVVGCAPEERPTTVQLCEELV